MTRQRVLRAINMLLKGHIIRPSKLSRVRERMYDDTHCLDDDRFQNDHVITKRNFDSIVFPMAVRALSLAKVTLMQNRLAESKAFLTSNVTLAVANGQGLPNQMDHHCYRIDYKMGLPKTILLT